MQETIIKAIKERNVISFYYKGHKRIVEPFTLGKSSPWNELSLSAYRIGGYTSQVTYNKWRLYKLDKISDLVIEPEKAESYRMGYNSFDTRMNSIICTV